MLTFLSGPCFLFFNVFTRKVHAFSITSSRRSSEIPFRRSSQKCDSYHGKKSDLVLSASSFSLKADESDNFFLPIDDMDDLLFDGPEAYLDEEDLSLLHNITVPKIEGGIDTNIFDSNTSKESSFLKPQ